MLWQAAKVKCLTLEIENLGHTNMDMTSVLLVGIVKRILLDKVFSFREVFERSRVLCIEMKLFKEQMKLPEAQWYLK